MVEVPEIPQAVLSGLAGACIAAILARAAYAVRPDRDGWRQVTVGPSHWVSVGLGSGLTGLFTYIYLFVGSARVDAAYQMTVLFWMTLIFGTATLYMALSAVMTARQQLRWRGETLTYRDRGRVVLRWFDEVADIKTTLAGDYVLRFVDGTSLTVDADSRGAMEFIDTVEVHFLDPTTS